MGWWLVDSNFSAEQRIEKGKISDYLGISDTYMKMSNAYPEMSYVEMSFKVMLT